MDKLLKLIWLLLLFELFGPVCDNRNGCGTGPFQGNVDQKVLAVWRHVVEVPAFGDGPCLEEHFRRASFNAALAGQMNRYAHNAAIGRHVKQLAAIKAPARKSAALGY